MNCLIALPSEYDGVGRISLTGERAKDLTERHSLTPGIEIRAGVLNGKLGRAKVLEVGEKVVLEGLFNEDPPERSPVLLVAAVARPQTVKKVIQSVTLLGASGVHFVRSAEAEKSYLDSKVWEPENLERELLLGLEQAVDTRAPGVYLHKKFKPFVEDELIGQIEELGSGEVLKVIADPRATESAGEVFKENQHPGAVIAIGPEAGWAEHEVETFKSLGFVPVGLGPRMLRVETAVTVLLGMVGA